MASEHSAAARRMGGPAAGALHRKGSNLGSMAAAAAVAADGGGGGGAGESVSGVRATPRGASAVGTTSWVRFRRGESACIGGRQVESL